MPKFPRAAAFLAAVAFAAVAYGQTPSRPMTTDPNAGLVNLALVAKPSTSFVSGDQNLRAINDGITFGGRAGRNSVLHYGNWPSGGTQWVEYTWDRPISTNKAEVLWYRDGAGLHLPKACRLTYWNGTAFVEVPNAHGLGTEPNVLNLTTFDEVTTTRIRLEMDSAGSPGDRISTGITEFRVFDSGHSPAFPPAVTAGVDRSAVIGGRTFLMGAVKELKHADTPPTILWTKQSGPGEVHFEDPAALDTTATFTVPGSYVLQLTATRADLSTSDVLHVRVVPAATDEPARSVFTRHYTIDSPLWNARAKALIVHWIPHVVDYLENPQEHLKPDGSVLGAGGIDNFIEAGKKLHGEPAGRHVGPPWANAYVHNAVESMCVALAVDPRGDPEIMQAQDNMRATLNRWIPIILAAQEPDGYLQTRFTLNGGKHWDPRTRGEHEGYTAGYFIESAIADYVAFDGKDMRMYNAAKKLADCWYKNVGPGSANKWFDGHQEIEQALVKFARLVDQVEGPHKGDKYVALAKTLLDNRRGGSSYDQSQFPVIEQYEAVGHAVRAAYTYSGMAAVSEETGNLDYQSAVQSLWDNIVNKKYYITGGIGSGETPEGFGPDYSLPNHSYCESCSGCGEVFFQYSLNLQYKDAKYADLYEQTLYNAILGDTDLAGNNFCYTNALDTTDTPRDPARYRWHDCPCCVGNIPRTLLQIPTWMYTTTDDSLAVNLFIGSTCTVPNVAGTDIQMIQKTDYPWSGNVAITVNPKEPKPFTLKIRVPDYDISTLYTTTPDANGILSLSVNGRPMTPAVDKGYALITRTWTAGDQVDLVLPMKVQRITANPLVTADAGRVALRYGPLIYNIESVDQNVESTLAPDSPLTAQWNPKLLDGVVEIKGHFADGAPLTAIPNYARLNRGGRSIVWIKEQAAR